MEFSDLQIKNRGESYRDAADYVNTRISTGSVNPAIDLNVKEVQSTEENYEQLRLESKRTDGENNKRDSIQWKAQPKQIKCIIYTSTVMLVILVIIAITAVVVMMSPKNDEDETWTQWSAWSKCDVTCGNGTQTRLRLCYNPSISSEKFDCQGSSSESRQCQENSCPDYGVAFTAYSLNTSGNSYSILKFRDSYINKGDAYNSTTGVFTCKIPGVYHFGVTLTKQPYIDSVYAHLRISGSNKLTLYHNYGYDMVTDIMTGTITDHLNINDTVDVYSKPGYFYSSYSSFTGFLVSPDV